jgi:hypothetical protein
MRVPGSLVRAITQATGPPTIMLISTEIPEKSKLLMMNLGGLGRHPLKILQSIFYRNGRQGPSLAERIKGNAQVGDKSKNQNNDQEN